jgi:hypothetical protein
MPKGIPAAGFRRRGKNSNSTATGLETIIRQPAHFALAVPYETDEEIDARILERFKILTELVESCTLGKSRSLIVSGPAGLGKSFNVEKYLEQYDPSGNDYTIVKGYVRATGLYKKFFHYRNEGQIIVFDDADSIFFDDVSLNLLKSVCDTTENRKVSWLSEAKLIDDETAELIPNKFQFNGTIIFITNYDFDVMIERGHKLAPHLTALMSRSHYIDLTMKTKRDYLVRIRQVVREGMLNYLTNDDKADVMNFIEKNADNLRELSLRMAIKLGNLCNQGGDWKRLARVTCCKF